MPAALWTVSALLCWQSVASLSVGGKPFDLQESCKPENRKGAADALRDAWSRQFSGRVQQAFAGIRGPSMLTIGDGHSNALFFNFMAHANRTASKNNLVFPVVSVALDAAAMQACEAVRQRLPLEEMLAKLKGRRLRRMQRRLLRHPSPGATLQCVSLEGWLPDELFQHNEQAGVKGTGTCSYNMIIWTKPHILKAAVQASEHGVLMIDTDVVIRDDILKESTDRLAKAKNAAIVTGIENHAQSKINTGTVFVTKKARMGIPTLDAWIEQNSEFLNDDHGDQAALQTVFNTNHRLWQFAVTYGEAVGQCSRPAAVATHYNCYANKLAPMRTQGDWDLAAQKTREQLGLYSGEGLAAQPDWLLRKIDAMEAGKDWIVG